MHKIKPGSFGEKNKIVDKVFFLLLFSIYNLDLLFLLQCFGSFIFTMKTKISYYYYYYYYEAINVHCCLTKTTQSNNKEFFFSVYKQSKLIHKHNFFPKLKY
jgi:hypothetical protein